MPKLTLVGFTVSAAGEAPEPVRPILSVGSDALLLTLRLPVAVPVAVGLKVTLSDVDCPGASVSGREGAATAKPLPVTPT